MSNHDEITLDEQKYEKLATESLQTTVTTPDFWKTRIRVLARGTLSNGTVGTTDITRLCDSLTWQDYSTDDLHNVNTQAAMTGTIELRKQALRDYAKFAGLLYPGAGESYTARVGSLGVGPGVASPGALGGVIVCQVGYGGTFTNVWAMRVQPGPDNTVSETIEMSDGAWTLNLADDLWTLGQTVADFKYTKGKTIHKNGWRCDQIAHDICQQYKIPVRTLSKGTAFFALSTSDTQLTSPLHVITLAYQQETNRTGRTFIIRWGAPGKRFPLGALEVIPMRRNRVLYQFREQLTEATLTRSQQLDFATIIEARGQIQDGKKTRKITATVQNKGAMKRFGWVRKTVNYGKVSSHQELVILAQRSLAQRLTPLRTAELTNPGIATIRRGDAIHINLPEEGYANKQLQAYSQPGSKQQHGKVYAAALRAAEKKDPSLFAMPAPSVSAQIGSQEATTGDTTDGAADANTPALLPTSNQGVAFVTSAVHTVDAGEYTMDMTLAFVDVLDPARVRSEVDKAVRAYKASQKTATKKKTTTTKKT